tara:strand:- start:212 stop:847 length:636 start_codon:yes stop_codon:yes gene_type:complete
MALSKLAANSFDLTDNYALTGTVTGVVSTQKLFLIKNIDASSSSTVSFVNGSDNVVLDNTYKTYLFKFVNIHPQTDNSDFTFNGRDGSTAYDATKTGTLFYSYHDEGDTTGVVSYFANKDIAQGTGFQVISADVGGGNDESMSGEMFLFNPSSTTFVKHYFHRASTYEKDSAAIEHYASGYFNVTAAIDAIQFKFDSGNIASGRIALYGIK